MSLSTRKKRTKKTLKVRVHWFLDTDKVAYNNAIHIVQYAKKRKEDLARSRAQVHRKRDKMIEKHHNTVKKIQDLTMSTLAELKKRMVQYYPMRCFDKQMNCLLNLEQGIKREKSLEAEICKILYCAKHFLVLY